MNQTHDEFDDHAKGVFAELPGVPDVLQGRTVGELKRRRLLRRPMAQVARFTGIAALLIGVLTVGYFRPFAPPTQAVAATHLLLLYEDSGYHAPEPGDEAARVQEYTAWARKLAQEGKLIDAAELASESLVATKEKTSEKQGVTSEFGQIAGFFLIAATDARDADKIAAQSPHLKYGGRIVIRPLNTH